jgi:hypothetical protein
MLFRDWVEQESINDGGYIIMRGFHGSYTEAITEAKRSPKYGL